MYVCMSFYMCMFVCSIYICLCDVSAYARTLFKCIKILRYITSKITLFWTEVLLIHICERFIVFDMFCEIRIVLVCFKGHVEYVVFYCGINMICWIYIVCMPIFVVFYLLVLGQKWPNKYVLCVCVCVCVCVYVCVCAISILSITHCRSWQMRL